MPDSDVFDPQDVNRRTDAVVKALRDPRWRLNNLYWIVDKEGREVRFNVNWAQAETLNHLHHRTAILKARQLGITTLANILALDTAIFRPNTSAGIVAHRREDADAFFINRIAWAYRRLPDWLLRERPATKCEAGWLILSNGSSIRCSTSMRSGTIQFLHISELGKICAQFPEKAREIATGSLNAVPQAGVVIAESTAEGNTGFFYQYCMDGQANADRKKLSPMDWRLLFFPWWREPGYALADEDAEHTQIPDYLDQYFKDLFEKKGIRLSIGQKAWYSKKLREVELAINGVDGGSWDDMKREYPATPEEAFSVSVQGAYYAPQFAMLDRLERIGKVPVNPGHPIDTWWDFGWGDATSIWFTQTVNRALHVVHYFSNHSQPLSYYRDYIDKMRRERHWHIRRFVGPHDLAQHSLQTGKSLLEIAADMGLQFEICPKLPIADGIDAVRRILPMCWFDKEGCGEGLDLLRRYTKSYDAATQTYSDTPKHDAASHPADAFRVLALAFDFDFDTSSVQVESVDASAWS